MLKPINACLDKPMVVKARLGYHINRRARERRRESRERECTARLLQQIHWPNKENTNRTTETLIRRHGRNHMYGWIERPFLNQILFGSEVVSRYNINLTYIFWYLCINMLHITYYYLSLSPTLLWIRVFTTPFKTVVRPQRADSHKKKVKYIKAVRGYLSYWKMWG